MFLKRLSQKLLLNSLVLMNGMKVMKRSRTYTSYDSTIYSLSTNIKDSGSPIAVIRVSGLKTCHLLQQLIKNKSIIKKCLSNPRNAVFTQIHDNRTNELLDKAIVIWFPKPNSYTGEDMCEFHIHGSNAVITGVLNAMSRIEGCRPSEAGESPPKRALINNKNECNRSRRYS